MKKERKVTQTGATIIFYGPVIGRDLEELIGRDYSDVIVKGELVIDKTFTFEGNLYVEGNILSSGYNMNVSGNLYCTKEVYINEVIIGGNLYAEHLIYSKGINVKGDLETSGNIINDSVIKVSGSLKCNSKIISKNIWVGENLYCREYMNVRNSDINIAGDLECHGSIDADKINVLGKMNVYAGTRANKISVGY